MAKTITIKIKDKSENLEQLLKNIIKLYREEVKSFTITEKGRKPTK